MRTPYIILLVSMLVVQALAVTVLAQAVPPYVVPAWWSKAGRIKLIDTVTDKTVTTPDGQSNVNKLVYIGSGNEPAVVIDSWWFSEGSNTKWLCQSAVGLRGYASDFPRVTVKINKLYTSYVKYTDGTYHYSDAPILVLGHPEDNKALIARVKGEFNPTDNTWQFGILVGVYNFETQGWEQLVEIWPFGNFTALPVYIDFIPEFYSYDNQTTNETTVIYGWRMRVWSSATGFNVYEYNADYKIAYENITVPTPVTFDELNKFVQRMRGWYIWIGAGLSAYAGEKSVRYCEILTKDIDSAGCNFLSEYVIGYPLAENWRVNVKQLYESFVSGQLEQYMGPEVSVQKIIAERNWQALYVSIIPWIFGLAVGFVIMQASKSRSAGVAGAVGMTVAVGWLMGWSPVIVIVGLMATGAALYVLMGSGEE